MAAFLETIADFGRELRPQASFVAKRLRRLLGLWATRRQERLMLAEMEERMLRDIGIDRLAAMREARRPFWDGVERPQRGRLWPW